MSKQPPADLAAEQRAEIVRWLWEIHSRVDKSHDEQDHDMTAALHRALRTAMQSIQRHSAKRRGAQSSHTQDMTVR